MKIFCVLWTFVYFCVCFCAERPDDVGVFGQPVHLSEKTTQSVQSLELQDNESEEDEWYDAPSAIMEPEVCLVPGVGHCGVFVLLRVIEEEGAVSHELYWSSHLMCADRKPDFPRKRPEKCRWGFLPMPWLEHCCGGFLSRKLLPPLTVSEDSVAPDPAVLKEPVEKFMPSFGHCGRFVVMREGANEPIWSSRFRCAHIVPTLPINLPDNCELAFVSSIRGCCKPWRMPIPRSLDLDRHKELFANNAHTCHAQGPCCCCGKHKQACNDPQAPPLKKGCGIYCLFEDRKNKPIWSSNVRCASDVPYLPQKRPEKCRLGFRSFKEDGCCASFTRWEFVPPPLPLDLDVDLDALYERCVCAESTKYPAIDPFTQKEVEKRYGRYNLPMMKYYISHFVGGGLTTLFFARVIYIALTFSGILPPIGVNSIPLDVFTGLASVGYNAFVVYESRNEGRRRQEVAGRIDSMVWLQNYAERNGLQFFKKCSGHQCERRSKDGQYVYKEYIPQFLCLDENHRVTEEEHIYRMKHGLFFLHGGTDQPNVAQLFQNDHAMEKILGVTTTHCPRCRKRLCASHELYVTGEKVSFEPLPPKGV